MSDRVELNDYKQQVADLYSRRSSNYDEGDWHPRIANRLVGYAQLSRGQQVLDIATGTGMVAIATSQIVGTEGRVVGIDISSGMLEQARQKVDKLRLSNVEFQLADAEALNFPANSFDCVFCSSALFWMSDLIASLQLWHQYIKPGGLLGFHAFADTSLLDKWLHKKYSKNMAFHYYLINPRVQLRNAVTYFRQQVLKQLRLNPSKMVAISV